MKSRLVMFLAVALAAVAAGVVGTRLPNPPRPPGPQFTLSCRPNWPPIWASLSLGRHPTMVWSRASAGWRAGSRTCWDITAAGPSRSIPRSQRRFASMALSRSCRSIRQMPRSRRSSPVPTMTTCVRTPTASGFRSCRSHRLRARDERPLVLMGLQALPAPTFVAAWRHIVTLFRQPGADNVTWLWTVQKDGPGTGPIASWWPGAQYVTWVGIDGYYYRSSDTFASVFGQTITSCGRLPASLSCCRRPPSGPTPDSSPRSRTCSRDGRLQDARAGLVRQGPSAAGFTTRIGGSKITRRRRSRSGWVCVRS